MTVNKAVREIVFRTAFSLIAIFGYTITIPGCRRAAELLTGHNNLKVNEITDSIGYSIPSA